MDFQLPELGEGIYEAELVEWLVQPGDFVKHGQSLAEVMTDKATMELPAPFTGRIENLLAEPGEEIKIGQVILSFETRQEPKREPDVSTVSAQSSKEEVFASMVKTKSSKGDGEHLVTSPKTVRAAAAPSVRRMAQRLGIDLKQIQGTGPSGRILIDDLAKCVELDSSKIPPKSMLVTPSQFEPGTRVKFHGLRRKIAARMVQAKQTIPHYTYVEECDVTELVRLHNQLKSSFAEAGVKLTYLPFFAKAVVVALKQFALVNASLDEQAAEIVLHDHYHLGIATDTPNGLVVPVVRDADQKSLVQIAREISRLTRDARDGKAKPQELRGSTFTITSIGHIGGLVSTPIINPPEVGILGIGKIIKRPVFDEKGEIRPADLVHFSFSFDHRIVDGALGAAFASAVIGQMSNPISFVPLSLE